MKRDLPHRFFTLKEKQSMRLKKLRQAIKNKKEECRPLGFVSFSTMSVLIPLDRQLNILKALVGTCWPIYRTVRTWRLLTTPPFYQIEGCFRGKNVTKTTTTGKKNQARVSVRKAYWTERRLRRQIVEYTCKISCNIFFFFLNKTKFDF